MAARIVGLTTIWCLQYRSGRLLRCSLLPSTHPHCGFQQELLKFLGCTPDSAEFVDKYGTDPRHSKQLTPVCSVFFAGFIFTLYFYIFFHRRLQEAKRGVENWNEFAEEMKDTIRPMLRSRFIMDEVPNTLASEDRKDTEKGETKKRAKLGGGSSNVSSLPRSGKDPASVADHKFSVIYRPQYTFRRWMLGWLRFLISRARGPRAAIFQCCRGVVKSDMQFMQMLLPYMIKSVLRHGTEEETAQIR